MSSVAPFDVARLATDLEAVVGVSQVLVDTALTKPYEVDITGRFGGRAALVVRPGSAAEVAAVLQACGRVGAPVVVQGGATGLVGGSVPAGGEVVLSTRRLGVIAVPQHGAGGVFVDVGAGASLASVQAAVRPQGWDVGVDLASRGSATVGGMVATNAGGARVLRYGRMREQVDGLRVVLADGSTLGRLDRPPKEATGFDLTGLLVGSEGTLGVVTDVRLRLVPLVRHRAVALLGVDGAAAALAVLRSLHATAPAPLTAAEFFLPGGLALVRAATGLPAPLDAESPLYLLVEVGQPGDGGPVAAGELLAGLVTALGELDEVGAATAADDATGMARLWRYRESQPESIGRAGVPVKLDVAVPSERLAAVLDELPALVDDAARAVGCSSARVVTYGHLAEGNLHVNVLGATDPQAAHAVTDAVLRHVAAVGGSVSAEHGVGRAKVPWLTLGRTEAEVAAMTAVKRALDPSGMLGPGVLLPAVPDDATRGDE